MVGLQLQLQQGCGCSRSRDKIRGKNVAQCAVVKLAERVVERHALLELILVLPAEAADELPQPVPNRDRSPVIMMGSSAALFDLT